MMRSEQSTVPKLERKSRRGGHEPWMLERTITSLKKRISNSETKLIDAKSEADVKLRKERQRTSEAKQKVKASKRPNWRTNYKLKHK